MAATGIDCSDDACKTFDDQKINRTKTIVVYTIQKKGVDVIDVDRETDWPQDWEEFRKVLPEDKSLYITFDAKYKADNGADSDAIVFIHWCPENCGTRMKMTYAGSKSAIKKKFRGIACEVHATDFNETSFESILEKIKSSKTN